MFINDHSIATFTVHSEVIFFNNTATHSGGAIYCDSQSTICLDGSSSVKFINSTAETGGACSIFQFSMLCAGNSSMMIAKNSANLGGALYGSHSSIHFKGNTSVTFTHHHSL